MGCLSSRTPLLRSLSSSKILRQCKTAAFFSTDIVGDKPILVRDYIRSALYDPNHGYFSKRSGPVGFLEKSIRFNQLQGRSAYLKYLNNLYKQHDIAWFTPVELFKPWYAHGIAGAILRTANLSIPLKIYEIGGGSGTCARCIMDYMMLNAPSKVYNNMTYTIQAQILSRPIRLCEGTSERKVPDMSYFLTVSYYLSRSWREIHNRPLISVEISPSLAKKQLETVGEVQSHLSRFSVECRDATDKEGWRHVEPEPCWVIMLEVLDNLPHDIVYSPNQVSPWTEVWLEKEHDSLIVSEIYMPIQDTHISQCIKIIGMDKEVTGASKLTSAARNMWSKAFPKPRRAWLPTGCLQLLEVLHWALPKMSFIASDFSYLPDIKIAGDRAPLVSTKKDGRTIDHSSYIDAKGDADIFFPTDFWLLERIDHHCSGYTKETMGSVSSKPVKKRRTITLDTAAFMEEFGLPSKTKTKDGYNPLLDDFKNTKFYLSVPTHNSS